MRSSRHPFWQLTAFLLFLVPFKPAKAQTQPPGMQAIISKIDTFRNHLPAEKLYLQFDKPYYATGDTLWFKAYLLDQSLEYSPLSSRLYVELLSDSGKVVRRIAAPMSLGISWGNLALNDMREGLYTLRAYTNWMRNFGSDYFFTRSFYVANPQKQNWLVNASSTLGSSQGKSVVKTDIRFTALNDQPVGLQDLQLRVMDGKRVIYKGDAKPSADGSLSVSYPLPDKGAVKNLTLVTQERSGAKRSAAIPIRINRAGDIDLQFMPEGGYMVAGLPAHMGFKAVGEDGRGVEISGKIVNTATGDEVTEFHTLHKGMGLFDLAPQPGDSYLAKITLPDGQTRDVPLPPVKPSGTSVRIRNNAERDTLDVFVLLTADQLKPGTYNYLVGQSRGTVCFAASVPASRPYVTIHVAKNLFPTGLAHFTLLNSANQPLNERITFINHNDNLKVGIEAGRKFAPHDSIPLNITVSDAAGKPVVGSFSVAVTDDAQVKADSSSDDNIFAHMLLTSDLKGYVEEPGYYFGGSKASWQALDALLITQGWIGYDWTAIMGNPPKPAFVPEYQYMVSGKVTNILGKPIAKAEVLLLSKGKYNFFKDTTTNAEGRFLFKKFPPIDSVTFVLEAVNSRHKVINSGITMDDSQAPAVDAKLLPLAQPWYINSSAEQINYAKTNPQYHNQLEKAQYGPQGKILSQVTVRDRAIVKGSANLNGAGEADQVIDEETIVNANKMTLGDLLEQKVQGFRVGYPPKSNERIYFLKDKRVHFVFDGVDINRYFQPIEGGPPEQLYYYIKQYLDYFTAEDIKGIEVLYSLRYASPYNIRNLSVEEILAENPAGGRGAATAAIEITTRAGNGPFSARATGIYVYKPMLITMPKQFYRPRYTAGKTFQYADLRSTIHWDPAVVTDKEGRAKVSFYAADKPTTYTIILQGSDLNGKLGYQTGKVTIGP